MFHFNGQISKRPTIIVTSIGLLMFFFLATSNHYKDSSENSIFEGSIDLPLSATEFESEKEQETSGNDY